jgi:hypothetical protein
MASAVPVPSGYLSRPSRRDRAVSAGVALGFVALLIWALIRMGVITPFHRPEPRTQVFTLAPPVENPVSPRPRVATSRHPKPQHEAAASAPPAPTKPVPATKTVAPPAPTPVIPMTSSEFAATDISKIHHDEDAGASGNGADSGAGDSSASVYGPGEGPGGERLYKAEWYREPTHAEMATYLPANTGGWANVACRTIDHYHVDNCRSLGETPGSGLARAVRQAAWQFLIRPPRIGGKPLVGAWVVIHFDVTELKQ